MKKNVRFLLMVSLFFSAVFSGGVAYAAQAEVVESEIAPPFLSFGQVVETKDKMVQARNDFIFWLGKHYRCLLGGNCTRAEKKQVAADWKRWGKRLGAAAALGLLAYYAKQQAPNMRRAVREMIKNFTEGVVVKLPMGQEITIEVRDLKEASAEASGDGQPEGQEEISESAARRQAAQDSVAEQILLFQ